MAFPCNQFGAQEPGTDEEILEFTKKYDFNGDLTAKCDINKSDSCDGHPLWNWMIGQAADKETGEQPIRWNFTKFLLIDGQGQVICREHTKAEAINLTPAIEICYVIVNDVIITSRRARIAIFEPISQRCLICKGP